MPKRTKILGKQLKVGERMTLGKRWRLISPGRRRTFKAELLGRCDGRYQGKYVNLVIFRIYE